MRSAYIMRIILIALLAAIVPAAARAARQVQVVCTIPTLRAIAMEIGGQRTSVISLAKGDQDPHFVTATPLLMQQTRNADLFVENGLSLELWSNQVVDGSGNSKIFRGAPGRIVAGEGISALEIPRVLSREFGDIHPHGNPHVWLDPLQAKVMARNIGEALKRTDPAGAAYYESRLKSFSERIDNALFGPELLKLIGIQKLTRLAWSGDLHDFLEKNSFGGRPLADRAGGWLKRAEGLRDAKAIEFHRVWAYFARVFGMRLAGTIEERPGIPAGPQHIRQVIEQMRSEDISLILVDNYFDPALPMTIARQTGATVALLPNQVEGEPGITTYFELIDYLIEKITQARADAPGGAGKGGAQP